MQFFLDIGSYSRLRDIQAIVMEFEGATCEANKVCRESLETFELKIITGDSMLADRIIRDTVARCLDSEGTQLANIQCLRELKLYRLWYRSVAPYGLYMHMDFASEINSSGLLTVKRVE
jgi:hypothetical protein